MIKLVTNKREINWTNFSFTICSAVGAALLHAAGPGQPAVQQNRISRCVYAVGHTRLEKTPRYINNPRTNLKAHGRRLRGSKFITTCSACLRLGTRRNGCGGVERFRNFYVGWTMMGVCWFVQRGGREDDVHVGLSFGYLKARADIVNISP